MSSLNDSNNHSLFRELEYISCVRCIQKKSLLCMLLTKYGTVLYRNSMRLEMVFAHCSYKCRFDVSLCLRECVDNAVIDWFVCFSSLYLLNVLWLPVWRIQLYI